MIKNYLSALTLMFSMGLSAQHTVDLKSQIALKEKELSSATTISRSAYNDLNNQLQNLYVNYKDELELQLKSITDVTLRTAKEKELAEVNQKISK